MEIGLKGSIGIYLTIWKYILKSILVFKFGNPGTLLFASGWGLNKKEYGLPQVSEKDWKFALRWLIKVLKGLTVQTSINGLPNTDGVLILNLAHKEIRLGYLEYFDKKKEENYSFYPTDELLFAGSFIEKFVLSVVSVLLAALIFPFSLFSKKKYTFPILLEDSIKLYNLTRALRENKTKRLIHFNIYNRWSNLLGVVLKKYNIELVKVPSEVPISIPNSHIVTDTLVYCHPYQSEEAEYLKNSVHFNNTEMWGPEQIHKVADFYQDKAPTKSKTIGFYSSGMWFRKKRGDIEVVKGQTQNEDILAGWLKEFIIENQEVHLQVYLHPNELKPENIASAKEHWNNIFSGITISFMNENTPSNLQFHKTLVGVSLISTIMFERDYLGFPTIIVPLGTKDFPIKNSSFDLKSCKTKDDLIKMLDKAIYNNS